MDDLSCLPIEEVETALHDLERVNRIFGNWKLLTRHLSLLTRSVSRRRELVLADLGTGGGDLSAVAARWAADSGRTVRVLAMDRSEEILDLAARRLRNVEQACLLRGDATRLPFPDRSIDILFCSQVLHHLPDTAAISVMSEMTRVCRIGWIVSDLRRGRIAHKATQMALRLVSRNRLIRYDGPLSILRSFTLKEYRQMAAAAGAGTATIRKHLFFRAAIIYRHPGDELTPPEGDQDQR
ncbi:MAG: methyltransferase domain-containing protein [Acidobacteria bacterium]|nr:methyltransferase domain-containing protein [Acidobacteriota bacterium]